MSSRNDAAMLEALLPKAMTMLFRCAGEDPLRHHSVGQIRLMRILFDGSRTATELGLSLGLSPSSLTQMASRMILAGLISKEHDASDRRVRKLSLTSAGRDLMVRRQSMRVQAAAKRLATMPPARVHELISILEDIAGPQSQPVHDLMEAAI